jgi:hypothetical protein
MKDSCIKYRKGYKYQLVEDYHTKTKITGYDIDTEFIKLDPIGNLLIKHNYVWDGCSGPAWDDRTNMRGGLGHDAKYQLMRMGLLLPECRKIADEELKQDCLDDKMNKLRAWWYLEGVDHFAEFAAKYGSDPYPILTAP